MPHTHHLPLTLSALRDHEAFQGLSEKAWQVITATATRLSYPAGEYIFHAGDTSRDLYFLEQGHAILLGDTQSDGSTPVLGEVGNNELIGELCFVDPAERLASLRTTSEATFVILSHEALMVHPDGKEALVELNGALAAPVVRLTRHIHEQHIHALEKRLEAEALHNKFAHFLLFTIMVFIASMALFYVAAENLVDDVYDPAFAWQGLILLTIPGIIVIRALRLPLSELGIRRQGLWRSLREAAILSSLFVVPALVYSIWGSTPDTEQLQGATINYWFFLHYAFHSVLQELGARGLLQTLFQKFLYDKAGHKSVFLTSMIFAVLHIAFGIDAVLLTFVSSIGFGYFYLRSHNLAGVSLLHYIVGCTGAILVMF